MNSATPFLLRHAPSCLPIRKSVSAIVGVCRAGWHYWLDWRHDGLYWRQDRSWRSCGWRRCSGRAPTVVHPATPSLLVSCPRIFNTCSAIEWVHWTRRCWTCGWWRWRRRGWWRGWRCGERSGRDRQRRLRQSCGGARGGATPAHGTTTEVLLTLGPRCFPH